MKKIRLLLLFLLCLLFVGCGKSEPGISIETYNNDLISLQEQSVATLQNYYQSLEKEYNGKNLDSLYDKSFQELTTLAKKAQDFPERKKDAHLKNAVSTYILQLQKAFETHEKPVVEMLNTMSQEGSGSIDRYRENRQIFSSYAMKLAKELADLDKILEQEYQSFRSKYLPSSAQKK